MSDEEVLAHYREKRADPFMTLKTARALEAMDRKFGPKE